MAEFTPIIFDNTRRLAIRARAASHGFEKAFLVQTMANELAERLSYVSRKFENILVTGPIAQFADSILGTQAYSLTKNLMLEEDILPFAPESFDLILSAGTLDSVNDLPGTLVQIRRTLKPDGLFLGTLFGAGSLRTLKAAMLHAEGEQVRPHIHPQIDLRAASDLMTRTGFALPVADIDTLEVRYSDWRRLVRDLRESGASNALSGPRSFNRSMPNALDISWQAMADPDGRVTENFNFLQLSGWGPSASQPKPAARGSATVSLADALKKRSKPVF